MPKEIMISPHENVKITVTITEQMEKDLLECERMADKVGTDEFKDCNTCSWNGVKFDDVCFCELEVMRELLKEE